MNKNGNIRRLVIDDSLMLKLSILMLFAIQLWSYIGADWVIEKSEWSTQVTVTQMATNNLIFISIRYIALALILGIFLFTAKLSPAEAIGFYVLFAMSLGHTIMKLSNTGLIDGLYQSNVPLMYLLLVGFWIGKNQGLWRAIRSVIPFLLAVYVAAFGIAFLTFFVENDWAIFQNSSLMNYYSHAFAMALPFFYTRFREKKSGIVTYLLLLFFLVGAVLLRSRSWLIQSVLLLLGVGITAAGVKGMRARTLFRFVLLCLLVVASAMWLFSGYLSDFFDSIVEKGTVDSRSVQYLEMLQQTEWYAWIFGKGADATYVSNLYGEYQFIDNEFFYLSFHYGVIFAILYFLPFLRTFFTCLRVGKRVRLAYFAAFCILLWILSVNGLSVFHRIHLDSKSFIIPAFVGYVYADIKTLEKGTDQK